jgi:outer membrane protein assembly factor BamA
VARYPLSKFRRIEVSAGVYRQSEGFENADVQDLLEAEAAALGQPFILNSGTIIPLTVSFVSETTRFAEFGPLSGSTAQISAEMSPSVGGALGRQTFRGDARKYFRLGSTSSVFALRGHGFYSTGENPSIFYFGGNQELRGYPYLSLTGNQGFFANAELRLPLIHLAATPIGILGPVRGTAFAGIGGARYKGDPRYNFSSSDPGVSYVKCVEGDEPECLFGEPVDGFHLVDGRASFGFGLQVFLLGYPMHFDCTKLTDLKVTSPWRFTFWIGYDF